MLFLHSIRFNKKQKLYGNNHSASKVIHGMAVRRKESDYDEYKRSYQYLYVSFHDHPLCENDTKHSFPQGVGKVSDSQYSLLFDSSIRFRIR